MFPYNQSWILRLSIVAIVMSFHFSGTNAVAGSCCGGGASATQSNASPARRVPMRQQVAEPPFQAPHSGQLTKTVWNYFEVVYGPQETRLYVFNMFRDPLRVGGVQGKVVLHVRSTGKTYTYPLHHVRPEAGQDYLATSVDLTRVRRGDMDVEFSLSDVPSAAESNTKFAQVFGSPEPVAVAQANEYLPPTPAGLSGGRGSCCAAGASCCNSSASGAIADCCGQHGPNNIGMAMPGPTGSPSPVHRLPPVAQSTNGAQGSAASPAPKVAVIVVETTPADDAAIRLQGICPVMKTALGSHGPPTKLLIGDQVLFVCCKGCVAKVQNDPAEYLAMVAKR